jgi:hypothetical protein
MIIFLHIPKAAGSAIKRIFESQYEDSECIYIEGHRPKESLENYLNSGIIKTPKLLFGHFDYGVLNNINVDAKYITMIRNPIDRVISHYYYAKNHSAHYLHKEIVDNKLSLKEYVESGLTTELNNGPVRMLIGAGGYHKNDYSNINIPYGKSESWMLEQAVKNIKDYFLFVGIQEEFEKSVFLIKKVLGWKNHIIFRTENKTKDRPAINQVDDETLELIKKYNNLDIKLYQFIKKELKKVFLKNRIYISKELFVKMLKDVKLKVYRKLFYKYSKS